MAEIGNPYSATGSQTYAEFGGGFDATVYAIYYDATTSWIWTGGDFTLANYSFSIVSTNYGAVWQGTSWFDVATNAIGGPVYIIETTSYGQLFFAGNFLSVGSVTSDYSVYIDPNSPATFNNTTCPLTTYAPYRCGYYNGETAVMGQNGDFYKSNNYQSWNSLANVGGSNGTGIDNFAGDWKVILANNSLARTHSTIGHACEFQGSFVYDAVAYSKYTITPRNVSQQFIGDVDNSYWSIIGQGVGVFSN